MVKVNDANNVTNGCWPRANLEEAKETYDEAVNDLEATPAYKAYKVAERPVWGTWTALVSTPEYKAKEAAERGEEVPPEYEVKKAAWTVVKETPVYKVYKEARKAIIATPGHKTLVKTWRERQASWEAFEEAKEGLNNGK